MNHGSCPNSLDQITVSSFLRGFEFRELVLNKINDLDPGNASHSELETRVRILLDLIEESRLGRYVSLPLSVFALVLVEIDHFLRVDDQRPDTRVGGYLDDLARIQELFTMHELELERFLKWRESQVTA